MRSTELCKGGQTALDGLKRSSVSLDSKPMWALDFDRSVLAIPRKGRIYDLGLELSRDIPHGSDDVMVPFLMTRYRTPRGLAAQFDMKGVSYDVDMIQGSLHMSTHIDAF